MKRQPHARPIYFPPEEKPRESLALAFVGLAAIVVLGILVFVFLPVLVQ